MAPPFNLPGDDRALASFLSSPDDTEADRILAQLERLLVLRAGVQPSLPTAPTATNGAQ